MIVAVAVDVVGSAVTAHNESVALSLRDEWLLELLGIKAGQLQLRLQGGNSTLGSFGHRFVVIGTIFLGLFEPFGEVNTLTLALVEPGVVVIRIRAESANASNKTGWQCTMGKPIVGFAIIGDQGLKVPSKVSTCNSQGSLLDRF